MTIGLIAAAVLAFFIWRWRAKRSLRRAAQRNIRHELDQMDQEFKQHILNLREQLIEARKKLAVAASDEKKLQQRLDSELALVTLWGDKAISAQEAEQEELWSQAMERYNAFKAQADATGALLTEQTRIVEATRLKLGEIHGRLEDLKKRRHQVHLDANHLDLDQSLNALEEDRSFEAMEGLLDDMEDLTTPRR